MPSKLNVLLVTTWNSACGIAEHSSMLKEAVEAADSEIEIIPSSEALDPSTLLGAVPFAPIVHLNYQASLHSRWSHDWVQRIQEAGKKVVVTFHDTGVPNSDLCKSLHDVADAFIVHEPADDLPNAIYWRQGVPFFRGGGYQYCTRNGEREPGPFNFLAYTGQPILGTVGFPFPWKNYDKLAEVTSAAGWALLLLAPTATEDQVKLWKQLNPWCWVETQFRSRDEVLERLGGCDATAFCYVCHNTGTSAAIRQGIAVRKPLVALSTCRQFRDLWLDPLGRQVISWQETFEEVQSWLRSVPIQRVDPGIAALAEQDSWTHLGQYYSALYRRLVSHGQSQ